MVWKGQQGPALSAYCHRSTDDVRNALIATHGAERQARMSGKLPPPYSLRVRSCTIHAGRLRWDIHEHGYEHGRPIQSSLDSFATDQEAEADGLAEMEKLGSARRSGG
jgi:hypothetical protein